MDILFHIEPYESHRKMAEQKPDETQKAVDILVMRAAAEVRKAAALDRKRRVELSGVADYLESIVHEADLDDAGPLFPDAPSSPMDDIKDMMKPFKVRLSR